MEEIKVNSAGEAELVLTGQLNISNAYIIKQLMQKLIKPNARQLFINHEKAESFDASYLQLLVALSKAALAGEKELSFRGKQPDVFINMIKDSGMRELGLFSGLLKQLPV